MATGLAVLTLVHVVISLIGIVSGLVVTFGLLRSQRMDGLTALFLVTTVATSATGFLFPFHKLLPSHILGIISLVLLAFAIPDRADCSDDYLYRARSSCREEFPR